MLIKVTKDHIENGKIGQPDCCPIALASGFENVSVFVDEIRCYGEAYELPMIAQEFIENFDGGNEVKPISFEIALDSPIKTLVDGFWRSV